MTFSVPLYMKKIYQVDLPVEEREVIRGIQEVDDKICLCSPGPLAHAVCMHDLGNP